VKRIIYFIVGFLFALYANAQPDSLQTNFAVPHDTTTGFGTADGKIATKQIGPPGGAIVSEDGRVELVFPEGALTATTTISIQPTTNLAPNGTGKAYQFEPSGITFLKAVQIIFHYSDQEAESCPPELMAFAMQDKAGKWSFIEYGDWDSTSKTLKGFIHHFCAFTDLDRILLTPGRTEVAVNDTTQIPVVDISKFVDNGQNDFAILRNYYWLVNKIKNGNPKVGTITEMTAPLSGGKIVLGFFKASEYLPTENPVPIKLVVQYYSRKWKKLVWGDFPCYISIFDLYRIQIIHEFTARVGSKLIDSASFTVRLNPAHFKKIEITDINNYRLSVLHEARNGPFKETIFTGGNAVGSIDITDGITDGSISKSYPPEVYFEFIPKEILQYRWVVKARGTSSPVQPEYSLALPAEMTFVANRGEQNIRSDMNNVKMENKYKVVVIPLTEANQ
jgi:hypothetical protein